MRAISLSLPLVCLLLVACHVALPIAQPLVKREVLDVTVDNSAPPPLGLAEWAPPPDSSDIANGQPPPPTEDLEAASPPPRSWRAPSPRRSPSSGSGSVLVLRRHPPPPHGRVASRGHPGNSPPPRSGTGTAARPPSPPPVRLQSAECSLTLIGSQAARANRSELHCTSDDGRPVAVAAGAQLLPAGGPAAQQAGAAAALQELQEAGGEAGGREVREREVWERELRDTTLSNLGGVGTSATQAGVLPYGVYGAVHVEGAAAWPVVRLLRGSVVSNNKVPGFAVLGGSSLRGNSAEQGSGGGLWADVPLDLLVVGNSSVQANTASGEGGALWVAAACEGVGPLDGRCPAGLRLSGGGAVSDNLAAGGSGGAGLLELDASSAMTGNAATDMGGAVYGGKGLSEGRINGTFDGNVALIGHGGALMFGAANAATGASSGSGSGSGSADPASAGSPSGRVAVGPGAVFRANSAGGRGGGACFLGGVNSLLVTGAVFDSNEANTDGGGLAVVGPLPAANITNTTFTANKAAGSGGAIFHQVVGGALLPTRMGISSCSLQGNQADGGSGGGLAAVVFPAPVGRLRFAWATPNPEIPESAAGPDPTSGAVARLSYSLVLDSSVLQGNSAAGDGSGEWQGQLQGGHGAGGAAAPDDVMQDFARVMAEDTAMSRNKAQQGSGGALFADTAAAHITLRKAAASEVVLRSMSLRTNSAAAPALSDPAAAPPGADLPSPPPPTSIQTGRGRTGLDVRLQGCVMSDNAAAAAGGGLHVAMAGVAAPGGAAAADEEEEDDVEALRLWRDAGAVARVHLKGCSVAGQCGGGGCLGGGLHLAAAGQVALVQCDITGNTAGGGGGVYLSSQADGTGAAAVAAATPAGGAPQPATTAVLFGNWVGDNIATGYGVYAATTPQVWLSPVAASLGGTWAALRAHLAGSGGNSSSTGAGGRCSSLLLLSNVLLPTGRRVPSGPYLAPGPPSPSPAPAQAADGGGGAEAATVDAVWVADAAALVDSGCAAGALQRLPARLGNLRDVQWWTLSLTE
eukprot:XP_001702467.1 predicted protein [Chlamydomonas reinhardtii]